MCKISVIGICGKSTFMRVDHFHKKGETLVAKSVYEEIGGKGINQAVAAARMGADVSFLAAIGDDESGAECRKTLNLNNIKSDLVTRKGKQTTFAFILTDKFGENYVTEYKGAELCVGDVFEFETEIASSDILLIQQVGGFARDDGVLDIDIRIDAVLDALLYLVVNLGENLAQRHLILQP